MENNQKEVWYWMYCKHCKYANTPESEDPCNECLTEGSNENSHKPINYIWNGVGEEPRYDSTDERGSHESDQD